MANLPNGFYVICSSSDQYHFVGRNDTDAEDSNDAPKRIISLPLPPDVEPPKWVLERLSNGRYKLKVLGAPTGIRGGLLWAYSDTDEDSDDSDVEIEEWEVRPHRASTAAGTPYYTIEWAEGGAGWVRQSKDPYMQIAVAPLSGQGREEELWKVIRMPVVNS